MYISFHVCIYHFQDVSFSGKNRQGFHGVGGPKEEKFENSLTGRGVKQNSEGNLHL